jgi:hypothetical protein
MTTRYTLDPELAEQLLAEHPLLREVIHVESDEPGVGLRSRSLPLGMPEPGELDMLLMDAVRKPLARVGHRVEFLNVTSMTLQRGSIEMLVKIISS